MATGTNLVLTVALLVVPVLLLATNWMPKWIHRVPALIVSFAVIFRLHAFWTIDLTDAQVVGYLSSEVTGLDRILHIFDGPDGQMLGLLLGFAIGLAIVPSSTTQNQWSTLCWILILGWGIDSAGFGKISSTPLMNTPSPMDWRSAAYPLLGIGLSALVIPTFVNIESASTSHLLAAFSITIVLIDLSSNSIAWLILGLMAHRLSALRIYAKHGVAHRRRWLGLLLTFSLSILLLVLGLILSSTEEYPQVLWAARLTIGWILLCGILGALTPIMGYDSVPRPEAWGFQTGILLAPALLPNMTLIENTQFPIIIIGIVMPYLAILPEYRPKIEWNKRLVQFIVLMSILPISMYMSSYIPPSLILILLVGFLLIRIHQSGEEEE
ncbi:MAG: hypothetical protein QF454_00970 [Candidatus Thalassarchaeaceae archaeon]|nr:hypothetical protein [Candidatus Thalassarchaeaceae archaeon]